LFLVAAAIAAATLASNVHAQPAHRIISLNLCTDELALQLADRTKVISVSFLASDPSLSTVADQARGIPVNRGLLEEIVALKPDLVLAHRYASRSTTDGLRRLGYRVVEIESPQTVAAVRQQIADVADALGEAERGRRLIGQLDARLAALPPPTVPKPTAAIYQPNAYAFGRDTLADAILALAGFDNLTSRDGVIGYSRLALESLIVNPPDILVIEEGGGDRRSMAQQFLTHPVLRDRFPPSARIEVPRRYWLCAGLSVADAAELLAKGRVRR